ncbi:MAG TPA: UPF0182 family protein [Candidatus Limnocylindrales bacterium]|nr:UPF0182 family protein [Candidatus Limnocylindrales bacterium]
MSRRYRPFDPFERGGPFEAGREIRIPQIPRRFWGGVALFALAVLIFIAASPIVGFITELQWYDSLGFRDVYTTRLTLEWALGIGSFVLAFVYLAVNVAIALRARSGAALRAVGIQRAVLSGPAGWISLGAAAVIALILAAGAYGQWQSLALFMHSTPTGTTEPVLGQDISFYLLTLPFLHAVANWSLGLDFLAVLLIGALYSWRGDSFDFRPTPRALAHLSVLIAFFGITLAVTTWLGRYDLLYSHNSGTVWGAAYTDVNARLPLYTFQAAAGIVLAGALVANAWVRRLWIPIAAVGAWIGLTIVAQAVPAFVQGVQVTPNAQTYEVPFIQREIAGTRAAYGLSNVAVSNYTGDQPLTAQDVQNDQVTINNLRLWDYTELKDTYEQQQTLRTYYTFNDIDIDRYIINGQYQQIEISAREIDTTKLSQAAQNWVNTHLQYTHGYGAAGSPVNAVQGEGLPQYVVGDIPPTGPLTITQPAIYFGETASGTNNDYVLAPSKTNEFDFPQGSQDVFTNYKGTHGVPMTAVNKALWSLHLGDFNLLVSGQITDKSLMLYRRNIKERASAMAPFLTFDGDPYLVVVDGKLYWVMDAYTTASTYPYAQSVQFGDNNINYIRNSVKVVVDAYEGTTTFYVVDPKDPLIKAYEATFPSLFKSMDTMPQGIRAHLRVPEDLFNVQVGVYAVYHVNPDLNGAKVLFAREDVWAIPTAQNSPTTSATPVTPYYVLFRLPGEQQAEFLLIMPFTPLGKNNMVSWLAARSDGAHYGEYTSYVLPKDKVIFGPQQVANRINQNTTISADFTLFSQAGSQVQQGNLLVVPIGNSFLYFEPVYLRARESSALPELKRVILATQDQVVYTNTLDQAIQQLVGAAPPPTNNQPPPSTYTAAQVAQIQSLTAQANDHYKAAYAALARGDLTTFATEMQTVGQILQQLQAITGSTASPSPSPSPKPSPSP